jgi:hypothetical protein
MKTASNRSNANANTKRNIKRKIKRKRKTRSRRRVHGGDTYAAENYNYRNLCRRTLDIIDGHIHTAHVEAQEAAQAAAEVAQIANDALAAQAAAEAAQAAAEAAEAAEEAAAEAAEAAEEAIDKMFWDVVTKSDAEATEPELTRVAATRARALADRARIKATTISSTVETVRNIATDLFNKNIIVIDRSTRTIAKSDESAFLAQNNPHDINLQEAALLDHIEAVSAHNVSLFAKETNQTMADKLNDLISEELDTHDAAAQAERDATALENAATVAEQVASEHKANRHIWRNSTGKKHRTGRGRGQLVVEDQKTN